MVISQTNAELVFNAFRLANISRKEGDDVKVFLLAEEVELCPLSTMKDLYTLIREAECAVTF